MEILEKLGLFAGVCKSSELPFLKVKYEKFLELLSSANSIQSL